MTAVKELIAQAKEMIANVTPSNDGDSFNNTISEINAALDAMKMSVAGYGREADLVIINPFFSANGARGNGNTVKPTWALRVVIVPTTHQFLHEVIRIAVIGWGWGIAIERTFTLLVERIAP